MNATWDDEYLTVAEIAEHLKLNQQTIRNWIDQNRLPAVRVGRRVRVRRADVDRLLAEGATRASGPSSADGPVDPHERLVVALENAERLLKRGGTARRGELAKVLQELADAAAGTLPHERDAAD